MESPLVIVILVSLMQTVKGANILCVFPTPSYSHQLVFKAYTQALATKGHSLTIITPMPSNLTNVREIDTSQSITHFEKLIQDAARFKKRGLVADTDTVTKDNYMGLIEMISQQFNVKEVRNLINNCSESFDLLIVESYIDYLLVFSHFFKVPVIQISSGYAIAENFELHGAVSRHPLYHPNLWRFRFNLNLWNTAVEFITEFRLYLEFYKLMEAENSLIQKQFGNDVPPLSELKNQVQLLFVNIHHVFDNNRPVPPSVQYLGGLHLHGHHHRQNIDNDLQLHLDQATVGVVYVSFGSAVKPSDMDSDLLDVFLTSFEQLPYKVLWKIDSLPNKIIPSNVITRKWFPQREILHHKHTRVFVTQGGVLSTDEAIEAGVPLLGLPMMGDQAFNVNKYVELGIGLRLDIETLNVAALTSSIFKLITSNKYRHNIKALKYKLLDLPSNSLDRAVVWTEYVIKHKGQLKTKYANGSWKDYYMMDVISLVVPLLLTQYFKLL